MDYTDITIILDRSGSMNSIREATVKGINNLIAEVQADPGEGCWTLVQFDDRFSASGAKEDFPHTTFEQVDGKKVPLLEVNDYQPRGGTALIDAVCVTIQRIRARIKSYPSAFKPRVMVVIVTDGQENGSREFTRDGLRELTAEMQSLGWQFLYLGANQDAFLEAGKYGVVAPMNYTGLGGVTTSGLVKTGQSALENAAILQFDATARGVCETFCSGTVGVRAWKADGNITAEQLLSSCAPEDKKADLFKKTREELNKNS